MLAHATTDRHGEVAMNLDPFLLYLIAINAVAFLAFVIDFHICMRWPAVDDSAANSLIMDVFPIAGGALGMLFALFIITGTGRGHRMNKDNISWWFLAIVCLIVWGLVATVRFGLVTLDVSTAGLTTGWNLARLKVLGIFLAVVNVATFVAFAWDKHVAATGNDYRRRSPEARLLGLSLIGGAVGGLLAMSIVRHKTQKWYFVWGLPVFVAVDAAVVLYAHMCGLI
jgi:uncharacterized membrane protein YsdA (DUF1294 family)